MIPIFKRLGILLVGGLLALPAWAAELQLRIIESGEIQSQLFDFDYNADQTNPKVGYTRTVSLIKKAQREVKNSVYVDNGNLLQGTALGDYMLSKGLEEGEKHPSYFALEKAGAMATVIGQRELSGGLAYLDKAVASSQVPVLSANLFDANTKAPRYKPYLFKIMDLVDNQGKKRRVNVAFIGFTSPTVLQQSDLQGKILLSDAVLTAQKYVPLLKQLGAEVIIGLNQSKENQQVLSQVSGMDAVLWTGDLAPFGRQIGVLDLGLDYQFNRWQVVDKQFVIRDIFDENTQKSLVNNHFLTKWRLRAYHQATRELMSQTVGKTAENIYSYLSQVQDDASVQLVNDAQRDFVQRHLVNRQPEWARLPVLSAAAPYKTGKQHGNVYDYAKIEQGDVNAKQLADLVAPNSTVAAVKVNGAQLKEWLECSAGAFQQIQAASQSVQPLLNWQFDSRHFDVIDGVSYQFDLSQPARYNHDCHLVNDKTHRVKQLSHQGKMVEPKNEFIVATHSLRAQVGKNVVFDSGVNTSQVVRDFVKQQTDKHGAVFARADKNWQFASLPAKVSFETAASERAKAYVALEGARPYAWQGQDNQGFAIYHFDLNR